MKFKTENIKRVLIFRHGSLGDTVVALPCFHLIARAFPNAERRLLTTVFPSVHVVAPSAVLENTGLVTDYLVYPAEQRGISQPFQLQKAIRQWKPEVLIYLAEPRGTLGTWRDAIFFKGCGVKRLIGVPYSRTLRENRWLPGEGRFEHEAERLSRCLSVLGEAGAEKSSSWDLKLTDSENRKAEKYLEGWPGRERFFVSSVAAKVKAKDWGRENWSRLFSQLSQSHPRLGLVMVGAQAESEYSQKAAQSWKGSFLNLCGRLPIRETAALMKRALFYLGHDSGPMHLAAAVGLSCVAVFVECEKPGVWFPYGNGHRVVYRETNGKRSAPITVEEVLEVAQDMIEEKLHAPV